MGLVGDGDPFVPSDMKIEICRNRNKYNNN